MIRPALRQSGGLFNSSRTQEVPHVPYAHMRVVERAQHREKAVGLLSVAFLASTGRLVRIEHAVRPCGGAAPLYRVEPRIVAASVDQGGHQLAPKRLVARLNQEGLLERFSEPVAIPHFPSKPRQRRVAYDPIGATREPGLELASRSAPIPFRNERRNQPVNDGFIARCKLLGAPKEG